MAILMTAALVVVFGAAVWSKVRSRTAFQTFKTGLLRWGVTDAHRQTAGAALITAMEGGAILALLTKWWPPSARLLPCTVLLALFTLGLTFNRTAREAPCRCFGSAAPGG